MVSVRCEEHGVAVPQVDLASGTHRDWFWERFTLNVEERVRAKMDRFARDLRSHLVLIEDLEKRGISLRILDFNGKAINRAP
jgi:hypothetical protein